MRRGLGNPSLLIGGVLVTALTVCAIAGPMLIRANPEAIDLAQTLAAPGPGHWLGCDALGRDILARILWGARISLGVSSAVILIALIAGSLIGGLAALAGGRIDELVMRAVDIVLAFPGFLLAIALAAMGWTGYARLVRGELLALRERDFVVAAQALGARPARLLLRHLLPALGGPLMVQASFGVGGIIIAEAALSFLGLGVLPPAPSWGNMLDAGRAFILVAPHLTTAPGVAIGLAVLGFNLLGDGLAELLQARRG